MRSVDTREYLSAMENLIVQGETVSIPVSGFSMNPFLADKRDAVLVKRPERDLKRGDIVLYKRRNGQYILHRIWRVKREGYFMVGDAQTGIEGPIKHDQIIGLVEKIRRKGKWIDETDFLWKFFEKIWIRILPLRPVLCKGYSVLSSVQRKD